MRITWNACVVVTSAGVFLCSKYLPSKAGRSFRQGQTIWCLLLFEYSVSENIPAVWCDVVTISTTLNYTSVCEGYNCFVNPDFCRVF